MVSATQFLLLQLAASGCGHCYSSLSVLIQWQHLSAVFFLGKAEGGKAEERETERESVLSKPQSVRPKAGVTLQVLPPCLESGVQDGVCSSVYFLF